MPGPISDSYDPEFGTGANAAEIKNAVGAMYNELGKIIGGPPQYILNVVRGEDGPIIVALFTKKEWRILRFACERADESL